MLSGGGSMSVKGQSLECGFKGIGGECRGLGRDCEDGEGEGSLIREREGGGCKVRKGVVLSAKMEGSEGRKGGGGNGK